MTNTVIYTTTEISLAKLYPSPANARRTRTGLGIEALAASIQAHGLLQSLVVRPSLDGRGKATGKYEVVAGARRLAALKLLAKCRRITKGTAIPCRVLDGEGVDGAEASLAENVVRQDMHPADQFEAFAALHQDGAGLGIESIAARFGVSAHTVRQRLRLAVVSPALVQAYRDGALTLDHLAAFAVTEDQAAQERVHGQLQDWQRHPDAIRRLLTNVLVPVTDRRVAFAGLDAYGAAGGTLQLDLFSEDGGGWIADAALLERLVAERMEREAEQVRAEGWAWVAIGPDAQAGAWRCRRVWPRKVAPTPEDEQRRADLAGRYDELAAEHNGSADDLPDEVAAELDAIEAELAALEAREDVWTPADVAVAGAVLTLAGDGSLRVERGFVRPEDEPKPEPATPAADGNGQDGTDADGTGSTGEGSDSGDAPAGDGGTGTGGVWPLPVRGGATVTEPDDKAPALSATLQAELEAHRTAGLQAALAGQPELALRVMLHALATDTFYARFADTVARFTSYPPNLASACPGIADSPARQGMTQAEMDWRGRLPEREADLWAWLGEQDTPTLLGLLAVCVARTADAGRADWTTLHGAGCIHARVATAAGLDMRQNWTATKEGYLSRVPKALILDAVREGVGTSAAARIANSKKEVMAADAAALLAGTGWLPAVLHVPGVTYPVDSSGTGNQGRDAAPVAMAAEQPDPFPPSLLPDLGRPGRGGPFPSGTPKLERGTPGNGAPTGRSRPAQPWDGGAAAPQALA